MSLINQIKRGWNAFLNRDPTPTFYQGASSGNRPDRVRLTRGHERSIITSVFNRIAVDAASTVIQHAQLDKNDRYIEYIESGLNNCLTLEANLDQTGRAFLQDVYMSLFDEGCIAIVPTDTLFDSTNSNSFDVLSLRTGRILEWRPELVRVRVYNECKGYKEDIVLPKRMVGIVENPFYAVMNEPSSTSQRLIRKLNLLDAVDEQSSSGKLDLLIQLPYTIRSDARRNQAEQRRKDIESQLTGSKYGIAYVDSTEHVTQLNRPVENNLMHQIEYLTNMLYSQLGITQSILDGTADEKTMLNYQNRTLEPLVSAVVDEMKRKFLSETARAQRQSIVMFRDPFKLVPVNDIAELADKFTRNEILTSNEIRQIVGMKPSKDPNADILRNKNLSKPADGKDDNTVEQEETQNEEEM